MTEPQADPSPDSLQGTAWSRPRQWRWVAILAVAAGIAVGAFVLLHRHSGPESAAEGNAPADTTTFKPTEAQLKTFTVAPVAQRSFQAEERTDGRIAINADRATPVFSPYSGRVTKVVAGLGDVVTAGATLALIEATEFAQAQSDLATAAASAKLARINESRKHALYDAKGGSLQDWEQSQADLASAESALRVARNKLSILGKSPEQIAELERGEFTGSAALAQIVAPLNGVVVDRQVGPGQYLQAGASAPVFSVADVSSVWVVANVREASAGTVHRGQTVEVEVAAYPGRVFPAHVTYVAPTVDPSTHRVAVRAEIDNRDGALKPEMFATFRIVTGTAASAPGVPDSAVVFEGDAAHVWVLRPDKTIEFRAIQPGRTVGGFVEVRDGLKVGEQIVTKGSLFIDRAARAE